MIATIIVGEDDMDERTSRLALAAALCSSFAAPAFAQDTAPPQAATDEAPAAADIIVTARRSEERLQDVPVAVSVVTPAVIEARGTFNPVDIAQSAPGLNVTASISDRNNLTYTIRGQGFSFGTVFPAVITYFNEVPIARLTQGQFFDLANVQVLRGPQGVTFGRVTDGGNVMVTPQLPKNEFGGYVTGKLGNYDLRTVTGAINVPLVADTVLLRGAFEVARRDGFTRNIATGEDLDDVAYEGYRVGLTLRPFELLENTSIVSYQRTHDNGTAVVFAKINPAASGLIPTIGQFSFLFSGGYGIDANGSVVPFQPGLTPLSAPNYLASLQAQLSAQQARGNRQVSLVDPSFSRRKNLYAVNTTTLELSDKIEVKNIFGYVHEKEFQATNFGAANGAAVLTCVSACPNSPALPFSDREQISEELRLSGSALSNRLTWAIGGYADEQSPAGEYQNTTINVAILNRVGVNYITTKSRAVYGSAEFAVTDKLKLNGGLRYTRDTVRSEQNTYLSPLESPAARVGLFNFLTGPFGGSLPAAIANQVVAATFAPIPHGQCVTYGAGSVLYASGASPCLVRKGKFNATTWQAGASYKSDGGQLFYAKVSKGYRPGGVNGTAPPGVDPAYNPETDVSLEAGVKADFDFDGVFLRTNLAAYSDRYKKIQKNVVLPGPVPLSLVQNVNDARIKGVELEATLIPAEGLTLGGNLAYTDAEFDDQTPPAVGDPCDPTRPTTVGFCSDNRFNSVPKWQYALNAEYARSLGGGMGRAGIGATLFHQSSVALTDTSRLNPDSIEPGHTTIDANAFWRGIAGRPIDLGLFVTNLTNEKYRIGTNNLLQNASLGILGEIYAPPRMYGVSVKYRFGADAE